MSKKSGRNNFVAKNNGVVKAATVKNENTLTDKTDIAEHRTADREFAAITEYLNAQINKNEQLNNTVTVSAASEKDGLAEKPYAADANMRPKYKRAPSVGVSVNAAVQQTDISDDERISGCPSDVLLPTNTDNDLKTSDMMAIHDRNEIYNLYLKNYVSNFNLRTYYQRRMKNWFFGITMFLLAVIVILCSVALIIIVKKEPLEMTDAAAAITAVIGMISTFLVLPKVIGDNLFPSKEEDQTHEIFSKMVENDMSLRKFHDHVQEQNNTDIASKDDKF